uniref:Uncharacterized protein n=1 Tax=Arundo donax TaxID=35708 RepID=A0A0A9CGX3_ARUDO
MTSRDAKKRRRRLRHHGGPMGAAARA